MFAILSEDTHLCGNSRLFVVTPLLTAKLWRLGSSQTFFSPLTFINFLLSKLSIKLIANIDHQDDHQHSSVRFRLSQHLGPIVSLHLYCLYFHCLLLVSLFQSLFIIL